MSLFDLFLLGVAAWRLSSMLVNEDGPGLMFWKLRRWSGIEYDQNREKLSVPDGKLLSGILNCVWCCSVWTGTGIAVAYFLFPEIVPWLCLPMVLSTVAIFLEKVLR